MATFSFVFVDNRSLSGKADLICAYGECVEDLVEVISPEKAIEVLPKLCNFYL